MNIPQKTTNNHVDSIISYTYPKLYTGKEWYVGFYAFDPVQGKMRRKRIKINFIEKVTDRRKYAQGLMRRLIVKLDNGWNPWIEAESSKAYHTINEAIDHYKRYVDKLYADNILRRDTHISYISYANNIDVWNKSLQVAYTYIYQFDRAFVQKFLEHIYIERDNSAQTRDNYLRWMRMFSSFLVEHGYLKTRPTDAFRMLGKRAIKKKRTVIAENDMIRLRDYLLKTNKHYLLACYVLHYCFIRPKEMSKIQLKHISIKNQTIFIPDTNSKNKKDAVVTLSAKVLHLMIELNVFSSDQECYLFSTDFKPGLKKRADKMFRDYWLLNIRKELKFPDSYKFYSLKDTGITNMLKTHDRITVRDQARHASILETDKYTPHDLMLANDLIKNYTGVL